MRLITRMVILANRYNHALRIITEDWTARPVTVRLLSGTFTLFADTAPSSMPCKRMATTVVFGC
jgi:hypothetical protein